MTVNLFIHVTPALDIVLITPARFQKSYEEEEQGFAER